MMVISAAVGAVSTISGLYLSSYVNVASGAAVVMGCHRHIHNDLPICAGKRHALEIRATARRDVKANRIGNGHG
jgi:hypothetical protein